MRLETEFHLETNKYGEIIGWFCGCPEKYYWDILTKSCSYCNWKRPFKLEDTVTQTIKKRGLEEYWFNNMPMDDSQKELHAKFFAEEKVLYKAMEFDARRSHRAEIEDICFRAKAYISAMDWIEREENESLHPTQREWLRNSKKNPNPNLTDTITNIKDKKKRMSKADRLLADMQSLGIANATDLIAKVEKNATKSKMDGITFNGGKRNNIVLSELCRVDKHDDCPGRFRVGEESLECKCKCHQPPEVTITVEDFNF